MGIMDSLNGLTGSVNEQKTQLFFYDDTSFKFIKRQTEDSCLVEKKDNEVVKAWAHFFNTEKIFDGFKNIHADSVVLGFNRDFVLDPFNQVPEADKPGSGKPKKTDIKKWTAEIAEGQRYKIMNKGGGMLLVNKITIFLGVCNILMVLAILINRAGG